MVTGKRDVGDGVGIDATYQYITERPALEDQAEDVVYATDPEPAGAMTTEGDPQVGGDRPDDREGQTTIADWGDGR